MERSVSNTGRGKQREGEIKNGFSVVPGSYDQSKTYDAGKHETDRYYDRTCGCKIPLSSRNPDIDQLAANKSRLILLNKTDMADERVTAQWEEYFKEKGFYVARTNARSGKGVKGTQAIVMDACKEKLERDRKRGIKNRPIRAMIAGIPNVGKSTFINSLVGKACTKTGNKPGVTKGKQWIKLNKNIELLDTPGILWPKFEDQQVGLRLALIGSIRDEILNQDEMAIELIEYLKNHYQGILADRYQVDENEDKVKILEQIALNRNCKMKGNELDYEKASKIVLEELKPLRGRYKNV